MGALHERHHVQGRVGVCLRVLVPIQLLLAGREADRLVQITVEDVRLEAAQKLLFVDARLKEEDADAIDELMASEQFICFGPDTPAEARNRGYRPA